MLSKSAHLLLCNYDEPPPEYDSQTIKHLWNGGWKVIIKNNSVVKSILSSKINTDFIINLIRSSNENMEESLHLGIASFLLFCELNWSTTTKEGKLEDELGVLWPEELDAVASLQLDSEDIDPNTKYPQLLLLSSQIFKALCSVEENVLHLWWHLRCKVTHQRVLENTCPSLYTELELLTAKLSNASQLLLEHPRLHILLLAEISQAYLIYGRVQKAEECLNKAMGSAGLKLELKGILGKRTKFQQDNLPQLALWSEMDSKVARPSAEETHGTTELPSLVELQDDVRLSSIEYTENDFKNVKLPSLEQLLCLLNIQYLQKVQPKDNLAEEELQPYIDTILSQKQGAWSTRVATLLVKCKLESNNKRTVERAMMQCEAIVNDLTVDKTAAVNRLSYLWGSGLVPFWNWRQQLADLYLSLGLVKAALEEYLKLQLWEDVIVCYTLLQLRHKAAEIIEQQIDIKPTAKLYCLLGDATDDVSCYERAWEFSEHRSSRAQRHWGNYLFDHKKYEECIPHFEKSLEINSLQEKVWLRLGFAALETERWETSATAYRRYTYLQPNTFEAWNNLAKVYVKQGDKNRAHKALLEALKFNYDNWKLWENVVAVSMDTGHFEDVLRGCHRLLDIQGKFQDEEVLALLARAVMQGRTDADGHSAARLQKRLLELMGRITSVHPTNTQFWQIYSDISPTNLLRGQRLLKAYKGFTQASDWANNPETCMKVVQLTETLLEYSLNAKKEVEESQVLQADQQLSSARLTGQSVIRAAQKQSWPEVDESLKKLKRRYDEVMESLKP